MAHLHEILAVESDLEGSYKKILEEAKVIFSKKPDHFFGFHRKCDIYEQNVATPPAEFKEMETTVQEKLDYVQGFFTRYIDAVLQKEKTNQTACADLTIDNVVIAEKLPATFLLGLETRLKNLRTMYEKIPTLLPGIKWEEDKTKGEDVYVISHPEQKPKTAKTFMHKVLVPAQFPKEGEGGQSLPAQIEKWEESVTVGMYSKSVWSGMISPEKKSILIGRVDKLIRETKKARQRANATKVEEISVGEALFNFINV